MRIATLSLASVLLFTSEFAYADDVIINPVENEITVDEPVPDDPIDNNDEIVEADPSDEDEDAGEDSENEDNPIDDEVNESDQDGSDQDESNDETLGSDENSYDDSNDESESDESESDETEDEVIPIEQMDQQVVTPAAITFRSLDAYVDGYHISASGNMPETVSMKVEPVATNLTDQIVNDNIGRRAFHSIKSFDISLFDGDALWQPSDDSIAINISDISVDTDNQIKVYRIEDDGTSTTDMDASIVDDTVSFTTDHFTIYAIGEQSLNVKASGTWMGGDATLYEGGVCVLSGTIDGSGDLAGFDASEVTSVIVENATINGMNFSSVASTMKNLSFGEGNVLNTTDLAGVFSGHVILETVDMSGLDLSRLRSTADMFNGCQNLRSITFPETNGLHDVTHMNFMFYDCRSLQSLDFSGSDLSNVCVTRRMFSDCENLSNLVFPDNAFDATELAEYMFYGCNSLTDLDLLNCDFSNCEDLSYLFYGCKGITNLKLNNDTFASATNAQCAFQSFGNGCGLDLSDFTFNYDVINIGGLFASAHLSSLKLPIGFRISSGAPQFGGIEIPTLDLSECDFTKITGYGFDNMFAKSNINKLILPNDAFENADSVKFFFHEARMTEIDLTNCNFENVNDFSYMFQNCKNLEHVNFSKCRFYSAKNMYKMFYGCDRLTSVDLPDMNGNAVNADNMFTGCTNLKRIVFPAYKFGVYLSNMFSGCTQIESVDLSKTDLRTSVYMGGMFKDCVSLKELKLPKEKGFQNAGYYHGSDSNPEPIFENCVSLEYLDMTGCKFIYDFPTFEGMKNLKKLIFADDAFKDNKLFSNHSYISIAKMFKDCENIESIDLSGLNSVTYTNSAFENCYNLKELKLPSSFQWPDVFSNAFRNCRSLTEIDLSNVNYAYSQGGVLFVGCDSLETVITPQCSSALYFSLPADFMDISDGTISQYTIPNTTMKRVRQYSVTHEKQNADHTYTTEETETFNSVSGAAIQPAVKSYLGYTSPVTQSAIVRRDETTVVSYKYDLTNYKILYKLNGGTNAASNPFSYTILDHVVFQDPVRKGYAFTGWVDDNEDPITEISTGSHNRISVTATWRESDTTYAVEHYKQTKDGSYALAESETLSAITNQSVTPATKFYDNYKSPDAQTVIVNADGSTIVCYYYDLINKEPDAPTMPTPSKSDDNTPDPETPDDNKPSKPDEKPQTPDEEKPTTPSDSKDDEKKLEDSKDNKPHAPKDDPKHTNDSKKDSDDKDGTKLNHHKPEASPDVTESTHQTPHIPDASIHDTVPMYHLPQVKTTGENQIIDLHADAKLSGACNLPDRHADINITSYTNPSDDSTSIDKPEIDEKPIDETTGDDNGGWWGHIKRVRELAIRIIDWLLLLLLILTICYAIYRKQKKDKEKEKKENEEK